jgi:hypothetical protein
MSQRLPLQSLKKTALHTVHKTQERSCIFHIVKNDLVTTSELQIYIWSETHSSPKSEAKD